MSGVRGPCVWSWMWVEGDCLSPELPGGATVLIDRLDRVLEGGGTYLLKMGEELVLRRVGCEAGLGWVVREETLNWGVVRVGEAWVVGGSGGPPWACRPAVCSGWSHGFSRMYLHDQRPCLGAESQREYGFDLFHSHPRGHVPDD